MKVLLKRLEAGLRPLSPLSITTIALCWVLALGIADYYTPSTLTLTAFYFLAVMLAGWGAGKWHACLVSAVAAVTTFTVCWVLQRGVPHPGWVALWNNLTRFLMFCLTGWLTAELTSVTRGLEKQVAERTAQWKREADEHKLTANRLTDAVERFEQVINNITEVFWLTDVAKARMIYLSPGYERTWGRKCQELYREPESWLAAVHPADRDMVFRRASTEQAAGTYDVEYRIVRPDGEMRWIRDRAFPVRNAQGEVYRIAGLAVDFTERKQFRETLQMQAAILENMAEAVVVTDEQGVIVQMNPAAERIWGYGRDEVLGKPASVFSALPEPQAVAVMREVLEALRTAGIWRGTFSNRRKDGAIVSCEAIISRVEIQGRGFMVAVEQDVTERRQAERTLARKEELYRTLFELSPDGILLEDTDGNILDANQALCHLFGCSREALLDQTVRCFVPPEKQGDVEAHLAALKAGRALQHEVWNVRSNGERVLVWLNERPLALPDGRQGILVVARDITQTKRAEAARRQSEELNRAILATAMDGFLAVDFAADPQGAITDVNDAYCRMTGYSREELLRMRIADLEAQESPEEVARHKERILSGPGDRFETRHRRKDGQEIHVEISACRLAGGGQRIFDFVRDITERKKAQQSLAEALEFNRQVVSASSVGIGVYRASGQCVMVNNAVAKMSGGTIEQLLAQDFRRLKSWSADGLLAKAEAALATRQPQELECESRTTFGRDLTVSARFSSFIAQGELHLLLMLTDQTAATLTRDALRVSEERYRTLAECSPDAIFILDRDIRVEYVNSAAAALWQRTPGELLGLTQPDLFPPEAAQYHQEIVRNVFATGTPVSRDEPLTFPSGDQWIEIHLAPLYDARGSVASVMGICRDITERKRAERRLTEALDLNQKMLAAATLGIGAYKASGECIFANEALARIVGGSLDALLQGDFRNAKAWQQSGLLEMAEEALRQGQASSRELFCETRFGKSVWLDCHMASFVSNGQPHLLLMALDVSDRKEAGAALRQAERLQKALLDNIPDPAWLKDAEGRFLACNQALARFYGQPIKAIIGNTVFDLAPREAERIKREDKAVMNTRRSVVAEALVKNAEGGVRWLESIKSPLCNERDEVIGTVGIARDVTEHKQTESLLRAQRDLGVSLSTTSDASAALRCFLEAALKTGGFDSGGVYLLNQGTQTLDLAEHRGASPAFVRAVAQFAADSPQMKVVRHGRPVFTSYDKLGVPLDEVRLREGLQGIALLPLNHEREIIGALALASHTAKHISAQTRLVVEALATQAAGAIARIRAETERHRLERQLLEITDREQARIGQDVHDGLCQHLVSLAFDANSLARELSSQRRPQAPIARRLADLADQTITETRQLARGLFPVRLESEGLPSALEELANSTRDRFKVHCRFRTRGEPTVPSSTIATHLYRIAQEAVANAVKHSQARAISIDLITRNDQLWLKVEDDGKGLRAKTPKDADGMGLHIMDYRARSIGGTLRLAPRRRGGTQVFCCVPRQFR